ncbi:MAG: PstS family phosphate ABC transporter substrate-binding protein [Deltaproteobacteria bacterium]|nr:PstS family phosphate ABC transporter substrate-binding protein [Deltaproteobacteria bacterium]
MEKKTGWFFWMLAAGLILAAGPVSADSVVIKGSTTVLPIAQATLEAFMKANPGTKISLSGGGSGDGIKALIDGATDIATSSRQIKPAEVELAKTKGVNPVETRVAIDAIVPIVHPGNPVNDLSLDQLSQIYQGKITNWKEVGGRDLQIVAISRDSSSGTFEAWGELILKGAKVTPRAQLQASNGAIVQAVSKNRYALGYIGLGYLDKSVKALSVNGIRASEKTASMKAYPVSRALYLFTNGEPKGETARYIRFVLSPAGQALVKREGFVPLSGR